MPQPQGDSRAAVESKFRVKLGHVEDVVGSKSVGLDPLADNSHENQGLGVLDHHRMHHPATLEEAETGHLPGSASSSLALAPPTEIASTSRYKKHVYSAIRSRNL